MSYSNGTNSVGNAVSEADELDFSRRLLPFWQQCVQEMQSRFFRVMGIVGKVQVANSKRRVGSRDRCHVRRELGDQGGRGSGNRGNCCNLFVQ